MNKINKVNKVNKCFKVVRRCYGGYLKSAAIMRDYEIVYEPGKVTKPKIGQIFVFDTLENARQFAWILSNSHRVYECECGPLEEIQSILQYGREDYFQRFWDKELSPIANHYHITTPPRGSMITPWVKLIEEVIV